MENLKREILAQQKIKNFAKKALAEILPQMAQFIGKKIFLGDGSKAKIFNLNFSNIAIEQTPNMHTMVQNCYLKADYGKLVLRVKICLNGGNYDVRPSTAWTKYIDRDIEIGISKDGQIIDSLDTIEHIIELHGLNRVINEEAEIMKIKQYKALLKQAEDVKRTIVINSEFYEYL